MNNKEEKLSECSHCGDQLSSKAIGEMKIEYNNANVVKPFSRRKRTFNCCDTCADFIFAYLEYQNVLAVKKMVNRGRDR